MKRRVLLLVTVLVVGTWLYFEAVYRHPTTDLIAFISRNTANSLPPPRGSTPPPTAEAGTESESKPISFRSRRFNAKLHMVNQAQLFIDYPLAYWLTVDVDMASWSWVSANLISIIHPIFGLAAGYLIIKAANSAVVERQPPAPREPSSTAATPHAERSGLLAASPQAPSPAHHSVEMSPLPSGGGDPPASGRHHERTKSSSMMQTPAVPLTDADRDQLGFSAPVQSDHTEEGKVGASGTGANALFSSVNVKLLRIAAVLFAIRNFLDTMDGVVARVQRNRAGAVAKTTTMGFNGHSLDMATDTLGAGVINISIFILLYSKNLTIARLPRELIARSGWLLILPKGQFVSRVVAMFGLGFVGFNGLVWETFMLRYSNLFDQHANDNEVIFALDNNFHVRLSEFLWALTCGDSILNYTILALCANRLWEFAQFMFFIGYPWLLLMGLYSSWVWHRVVLADPTAASIVSADPELFL